jgi:hypothetical protein
MIPCDFDLTDELFPVDAKRNVYEVAFHLHRYTMVFQKVYEIVIRYDLVSSRIAHDKFPIRRVLAGAGGSGSGHEQPSRRHLNSQFVAICCFALTPTRIHCPMLILSGLREPPHVEVTNSTLV